ncbi:MAG: hypothetical protein ACK5KR_01405 [Breznakia sp.]
MIAFYFMSSSSIKVNAHEKTSNTFSQKQSCNESISLDESFIKPLWIASCPNGTKHMMVGRGFARIYSGSYQKPGKLLVYGFTQQCKNCYLAVGSQESPRISGILGKYTLINCDYLLSPLEHICRVDWWDHFMVVLLVIHFGGDLNG